MDVNQTADLIPHNLSWFEDAVTKKFNSKTPVDQLERLELTECLINVYGILRRLIVALKISTEGCDQFKLMVSFANLVLTELTDLLGVLGVFERVSEASGTVQEAPQELFVTSETKRRIRDWIVMREYVNRMEYILDVLTHFQSTLQ